MRKILISILVGTLLVVPQKNANAEDLLQISFAADSSTWGNGSSPINSLMQINATSRIFYSRPSPLPQGQTNGNINCGSIIDPDCSGLGNLYAHIVSAGCDQVFKIYCIQSLSIIENRVEKPLNVFFNASTFSTPGNSSPRFPAGAIPPLFSLPNQYMGEGVYLAPIVASDFSRNASNQLVFQGFRAELLAVKILTGSYKQLTMDYSQPGWGFGVTSDSAENWRNCLWTFNNTCVIFAGELPNLEFKLDYLTNGLIGGWWFGRLDLASVSTKDVDKDAKLYSIIGRPIKLQNVSRVKVKLSSDEMKQLNSDAEFSALNRSSSPLSDFDFGVSGAVNYKDASNEAFTLPFTLLEVSRNGLNDKSQSEKQVWSVNSIYIPAKFSTCLKPDIFQGMIATNALIYGNFPPLFKNGVLEYDLAALHYDSKGNVFGGSYSIIIFNELLKCLYGVSEVPNIASLSIKPKEEQDSFVIIESKNDGTWTSLNARPFTYSRKIVKVKFSVNETKNPTSNSNSVPNQAKELGSKVQINKSKNRTTITCIKGKLAKKITAFNPKCPAGFKKK